MVSGQNLGCKGEKETRPLIQEAVLHVPELSNTDNRGVFQGEKWRGTLHGVQ